MLQTFSRQWARAELACAATLAAAVTALILLNVLTRNLGLALFWVDELAIYAMIWMTLLAASAAVHHKDAVAVTIVTDALPQAIAQMLSRLVDAVIFALALLTAWFCWRWFLPLEFARAGFDVEAFQGATFNFIYSEATSTLGVRKVWVWSIMWIFAFGLILHSLNNLLNNLTTAADRKEQS